MKKSLLLGFTLLTAACAFDSSAAVYEATGEKISQISDLRDGKYVIHASLRNGRTKDGLVFADNNGIQVCFHYGSTNNLSEIPASGLDQPNYVWEISCSDEGFTIFNVGANYYPDKAGTGNTDARGNWKSTTNVNNAARFELVEIPEGASYSVSTAENPRFWMRIKNNQFKPGTADECYPCVNSNGTNDNSQENVAFWGYGEAGWSNHVQFEFIPIHEVGTREVTVTFPTWNDSDIVETMDAPDGVSIEASINAYIQGLGGMRNIVIKSNGADATNLIVSADNTSFTVEGDWLDDFAPYQVYRVALRPDGTNGENSVAIRYMFSTDEIHTYQGSKESLSRLIPERLWYFAPAEEPNTYTMHTIYDKTKGVHFDSYTNGAKATLKEDATVFDLIHESKDNCFRFKVHGTENAYINEYGGRDNGLFSIWVDGRGASDNGSVFQLFALEESDMIALGLDKDAVALADDEEFLKAVEDYNAMNVAAALRRVEYWGGESIFGPQPGKLDNENGDFLEKLKYAREILAKGDDATDAEKEAAVAGIGFDTIDFNEIKPGMFYRFRNKYSGLYISSISSHSSKNGARHHMDLVSAESANRSNTVFYVHENEDGSFSLVSFDSGLVMSDFYDQGNDWDPVLATNDHAGKYNIVHQHLAACVLHTSCTGKAHRHLYGGNKVDPKDAVNCGDGSDDMYQWYVELVESLPIPLYHEQGATEAWASVYSPVALRIEDGEAIVNVGKFSGTQVWKQVHLTGDVIPANTPVLLDYKGGAENSALREGISYIYVTPLYNGVAEQTYFDAAAEDNTSAVETKDLDGGIFAIAKAEDTHYYTLHETNHNNFRQYTESYIPGFKAHIAVAATENPAEAIEIVDDPSTGVDEITVEEPAKAVKVYDLQGRKLAAPAKGINIINGQKVLVK